MAAYTYDHTPVGIGSCSSMPYLSVYLCLHHDIAATQLVGFDCFVAKPVSRSVHGNQESQHGCWFPLSPPVLEPGAERVQRGGCLFRCGRRCRARTRVACSACTPSWTTGASSTLRPAGPRLGLTGPPSSWRPWVRAPCPALPCTTPPCGITCLHLLQLAFCNARGNLRQLSLDLHFWAKSNGRLKCSGRCRHIIQNMGRMSRGWLYARTGLHTTHICK